MEVHGLRRVRLYDARASCLTFLAELPRGHVYTPKGPGSVDEAGGSAGRVEPRVHRAAGFPRPREIS